MPRQRPCSCMAQATGDRRTGFLKADDAETKTEGAQKETDPGKARFKDSLSGSDGRPTHASSPEWRLWDCNDGQKIHHVLK